MPNDHDLPKLTIHGRPRHRGSDLPRLPLQNAPSETAARQSPNDHEHAGCGEVVQADREEAADAVKAYRETKNHNWQQRIRQGQCDDGEMVQAFARHRIASVAALTAEVERQKAIVARVQTAARGIMHAEGQELAMLREKSRGEWVASQTLESEREANALLTAELERVRAETIEAAAKVAENMPIQIYRGEGRERSCKPATFDDAAAAIRALAGEGAG